MLFRSSGRERRRRTRSRSRERPPPRQPPPKRSRSPTSPFAEAKENWKKFKHAERVMLDSMDRKREIYDKRPEDHPCYPNEWKTFWEKRYKELQMQGKDADNHDYKSEWIPHWGKRVAALFEEERREKTDGLLAKYVTLCVAKIRIFLEVSLPGSICRMATSPFGGRSTPRGRRAAMPPGRTEAAAPAPAGRLPTCPWTSS